MSNKCPAKPQEVREFIDAVIDASQTVKDSGLYQRGLELRRRLLPTRDTMSERDKLIEVSNAKDLGGFSRPAIET